MYRAVPECTWGSSAAAIAFSFNEGVERRRSGVSQHHSSRIGCTHDAAFMQRRSGSTPGLSCVWDVHASLGLCRSPLPLAFDLEKPPDMVGARRMARARRPRPTPKPALVTDRCGPALCPEISRYIRHIADGKCASRCSHVTSKHSATAAGLLATAVEPARCMFFVTCIRDARLPQAAAGLRLERRIRWHVHHGNRGDPIEI